MKKTYLFSFLCGLFGFVLLMFIPALYKIIPITDRIPEITSEVESVLRKALSFPANKYRILSLGITYFIFSLPFFALFTLIQWFTKKLKNSGNKIAFLSVSFLFFVIGFALAFALFLIMAGIAISHWKISL